MALAAFAGLGGHGAVAAGPLRPGMPLYQHIFVIVEENRGFHEIMDHPEWSPVIHRLASQYGIAMQFYAEVHPSEANYVAMIGGDTFGIHDDDAFYCRQDLKDPFCTESAKADYPDHDITGRSLADQLSAKWLTWKIYSEDLPSAGSLAPRWPTPDYPSPGKPEGLYAAKHNGFANFRSVNRERYPELADQFVGFARLDNDLATDSMPAYAHIVPNQCNEMHGLTGPQVPPDCEASNEAGLIRRGDSEIGMLVEKIIQSKVWGDSGNTAIVVTWDESNGEERGGTPAGCCGYDPHSAANFGGGHIVTIVITNHGPRHLADPTPYNHYSLLRTTEAAFGIHDYLRHAGDSDKGVKTMAPLFAVFR